MVTCWESLFATILEAVCLLLFAALVFLYYKRRGAKPLSFYEILELLKHVDMAALLRLIDPLEEARLRRSHSRVEFAKIQATRLAAAREYFRKMVDNAIILQELGYAHLLRHEERIRRARSGLKPRRGCRKPYHPHDLLQQKLARHLVNMGIAVKLPGRGALSVLFLWQRLGILAYMLVTFSLPDLKDVAEQTIKGYQDLKESALVFARYSEKGIEVELASRL